MNFKGRWVLVTGASSGLGRAMAKILAFQHGANVVLVARRAALLEEVRREIGPAGVAVKPIVADLTRIEDVDRALGEATREAPLYGAILNAGVTHFGMHHQLSWADFDAMLRTNVVSTVRMTTELIPHREQHNLGGGLMLVASMAGLTPIPYQAAYSGTKAFVISFGCGLWHELHGKNVSLTMYAPGGVATEMTAGENFHLLKRWLMPVDVAARAGVEAFRLRRYIHVPGTANRLGSVLLKMLPAKFVSSRLAVTYRRSLDAAALRATLSASERVSSSS